MKPPILNKNFLVSLNKGVIISIKKNKRCEDRLWETFGDDFTDVVTDFPNRRRNLINGFLDREQKRFCHSFEIPRGNIVRWCWVVRIKIDTWNKRAVSKVLSYERGLGRAQPNSGGLLHIVAKRSLRVFLKSSTRGRHQLHTNMA